ncbi:TPA: hypothetical protein ACHBWE_003790 [Klebsiella pneumoniae]
MRAKSHSCEGYRPGAGRSTPELTQQLGIEAERGANKHAAAAVEYKKKKPKPHYAKRRKNNISEEMITNIGAYLRVFRIFVSDEVTRSVEGGPAFAIVAACSQ